MRFYQDDCERLTRIHWYWVDRLDYVTPSVFVSSRMDEDPGRDDIQGELYSDIEPRDGSIPEGTVISPTPKGTPEQWMGDISLADRTEPSSVCQPSSFRCSTTFYSVTATPACNRVPYCVVAPTLTVNGIVVPLTGTDTVVSPPGAAGLFDGVGLNPWAQYLPPGFPPAWWGFARFPQIDTFVSPTSPLTATQGWLFAYFLPSSLLDFSSCGDLIFMLVSTAQEPNSQNYEQFGEVSVFNTINVPVSNVPCYPTESDGNYVTMWMFTMLAEYPGLYLQMNVNLSMPLESIYPHVPLIGI